MTASGRRNALAFLLLISISPLCAQTGKELQEAVRVLNRQTLLNPSNALLEQRQKLVEKLIRTDPDSLPAVALTEPDRARLGNSIPGSGALLEQAIEWEGVLELLIEDDFEHGRSRTHWRIRTEGGAFEMFFGKDGAPTERAPGSNIHLRGLHSGRSVAVRQLSFQPPSLPQVNAQLSGAQSCSTTGPQKIAVLKFTFPGATAYPSGLNDTFFQQTWFGTSGSSLNTYWQQTSYGKTSATGQILGPFALPQSYTCAQSDAFETTALQAASASVDLTQFTRIALLFPVPNCSFSGLGTVGCQVLPNSTQVASVAWFPLYSPNQTGYEFGVVAHEHGHNLGLDHASTADYGSIPLGFLDDPGTLTEYGDPFSAMGSSNTFNGNNVVGQYPSQQTSLVLGWLQPSDYQEVRASGAFTVVPYENTTGKRALRILRDAATSSWLWLEYRQPMGIADSTFANIPGANVFNGALVHYENPNLSTGHTYLVDFNPSGTPNNFNTAALTPGQTWTDPASLLRLTVNSATSAGLSVSVNYDTACATPSLSSSAFGGGFGAGVVNVSAAAGCAWTISTGTSWISFNGATSGSGTGIVSFSVAPNSGNAQRQGYIAVARQSLPVLQSGNGTTILGSNPSSGAGASAQITVSFSDPRGAADINHADVNFFGAPGCEVYVDSVFKDFFLLSDTNQFLGPLTPGAAGTLANSQCTLLGSGSTITTSGLLLQAGLHLTFATSFGGTRRILASVTDSTGTYGPLPAGSWTIPGPVTQVAVPNVTGLTQAAAASSLSGAGLAAGTVTTASSSTVPSGSVISQSPVAGTLVNPGSAVNLVVSSGPPSVPSLVSVSPNSGPVANPMSFTAVYSDTAGAGALNRRMFLLNFGQTSVSSCLVQADPTGVYLATDGGSALLGPVTPGGTVSNTQCTLNGTGTSVVNSGNNSTLTVSITVSTGFAGLKRIYLYAEDSTGNTGFQQMGTITALFAPSVPTPVSATPSSGSGASQIFTAVYSNAAGTSAFNRLLFLLNSSLAGAGACFVQADNTGIYLVNDAGTGLLGPITPSGTLTNTQCTLNGAGTSAHSTITTTTFTISLTFKPSFAGAKTIYIYADDAFGNNSGFQTRGSYSVLAAVPTADSVTPSSASGTSQVFTAVYSDTATAAAFNRRLFVINSTLNGAGACFVQADPTGIYLVNDAGSGLLGPLTGSATLANNQCVLNGTGTSVVNSGNTSTVTVSLTFKPGFAGAKNIYIYAEDSNANNSGFQTRGTYTVAFATPTADSVSPASATGTGQIFTAVYSDGTGAAPFNRRLFLINSVLSGTGGCFVQVDPTGIYLVNDAGSGLIGPIVGGATLSNSQCTLNGTGTTLVTSGNTSTANISLTFKLAFTGPKNIYMYAEDTAGNNSGFQTRGTYTVATLPTADSVTSLSGAGTSQTFTATYSDPSGTAALNRRLFLINSSLNGTGACFVQADPTGIYLVNDADSALLGPITAGAALTNSQCTLNGTGTGVINSGNSSTVTLSITFLPGFAGAKNIYMYADNTNGGNSGFQTRGTYTVGGTPSVPTATSVSPNSGAGASRTFTIVYSDAAGNALLNRRLFLIAATLNGTGACFVQVDANGISLANDADSALTGPLAPTGTLANSQCTLNGVGSSVSNSATNTTVVLPVTFKPAFGGSRNIYMYADDTSGNNSGWQLMGNITTQ